MLSVYHFYYHYANDYLIILLTISPYTPWGVYCEMYPLLEGITQEFNFNISFLRMIYNIILLKFGDLAKRKKTVF